MLEGGTPLVLGTGSLAAGCVAAKLIESGNQVTFVSRKKSGNLLAEVIETTGQYSVSYPDGRQQEFNDCRIIGVDLQKPSSKTNDTFLDALAHPDLRFVATAATPAGLAEYAPLVAWGIRRRREAGVESPLTMVACENMSRNSGHLRELVERQIQSQHAQHDLDLGHFRKFVSTPNVVIDRICLPPKAVSDGSKRGVVVPTEPYHEWTLNNSQFLDAAGADARTHVKAILKDNVHLAPQREFEFRRQRKAWLVNGTHYSIAIFALSQELNTRHAPYSDWMRASMSAQLMDPAVEAKVGQVQLSFVQALKIQARQDGLDLPETESLGDYAISVLDRIKAQPEDSVKRAVGDLLAPRVEAIARDIEAIRAAPTLAGAYNQVPSLVRNCMPGGFTSKVLERIAEPLEILEAALRRNAVLPQPMESLSSVWESARQGAMTVLLETLHVQSTILSQYPETVAGGLRMKAAAAR